MEQKEPTTIMNILIKSYRNALSKTPHTLLTKILMVYKRGINSRKPTFKQPYFPSMFMTLCIHLLYAKGRNM